MKFPEVILAACEHYGWRRDGDEVVLGTGQGRGQRILIEVLDETGTAHVRATTEIGKAARLSDHQLRSALGVNAGLVRGALAIRDEALVLTETFSMNAIAVDDVARTLVFLAETADRYEKALFSTDQH